MWRIFRESQTTRKPVPFSRGRSPCTCSSTRTPEKLALRETECVDTECCRRRARDERSHRSLTARSGVCSCEPCLLPSCAKRGDSYPWQACRILRTNGISGHTWPGPSIGLSAFRLRHSNCEELSERLLELIYDRDFRVEKGREFFGLRLWGCLT